MQITTPATAAKSSPRTLSSRTCGFGESVVCLHSSTGSGAQWRGLQETLAQRFEVMAVDLHGHGRSPAWPASAPSTLHLDAAAVGALAGIATHDIHLVGHSYGAAVALQMALRWPQRVRSLTLYEPVVFGMLRRASLQDEAMDEIEEIAASVASLVRAGCLEDAARVFVGYWSGVRAWAALDQGQQHSIIARIASVPRHFEALFAAQWDAAALQRLGMPVLLMHGSTTRAPARRVADLLGNMLPRVQRCELSGAGHMGPLTHAATVEHWFTTHLDHRLTSPLKAGMEPEALAA